MNRFLLMSAAALLAGSGAANAGTHSFTFASQCDGGTINTGLSGGVAAAWVHTNANCASGTSQGAGLAGKVETLGSVFAVSDNYLGKTGNYTEVQFYAFNKKLNRWWEWTCSSGTTCVESGSGDIVNGAFRVGGRSTLGTAAKVERLISARHR